ncbi:MAG: A/G-specific adenine glycosylase [Acidimicrobiales bacterium]
MPPPLIASGVLDWWDGDRRDLPWRRTRDPWAVLVSEVMLQQTQVDRVIPKWTAFLDRFPDPARCAAAPVGAVIEAWAGLGYNRRGLALHQCARVVVDEHDGRLPMDLPALLALPGIGPYTARAVLAFAGERDVAVVDTNVARVLARQAGRPLRLVEVQADADALVPSGQGWAWNQAMLDLGATVCRARAPDCGRCPIATSCAWRGGAEPDPAVGSAGVSGRQSRFEGSDRQGRGRLVDALRHGPVSDVATATGWPEDPERAERVAQTLVADGLAVRVGDTLTLP